MAVHLYTGNLGGGKTLSAVQRMIQTWIKGGYVFTNVAVHWEAVKAFVKTVYGVDLQDSQLVLLTGEQVEEFDVHLKRGTPNLPVLAVIDEAGKYFNSKAWNKNLTVKMRLSDMLRESRKLCLDFIFVVQVEERLDKSFREIMEFRWTFRTLKWIPILSRFTIQRQAHADTDIQVSSRWWWRDVRLYALYDTYALYSNWDCAKVDELSPIQFPNKPAKRISPMMRICFLVGLIWACWTVIGHLTNSLGKKAVPSKVSSQVVSVPSSPASPTVLSESLPNVIVAKPIAVGSIVVEPFRSTDERTYLRTDSGEYVRGEWSQHGQCIAVARRSATIRKPDGSQLVVVARDWDDLAKVSSRSAYVQSLGVPSPAPSSDVPIPDRVLNSAQRGLGGYREDSSASASVADASSTSKTASPVADALRRHGR